MDEKQFDGLIRAFGQGTSRRGALGVLAAAAGIGLREVSAKAKHHNGKGNGKGKGKGKAQGKPSPKCTPNKACAKWCAEKFGANTSLASQCTSDAAQCKPDALCTSQCGPAAPPDTGYQLCGTSCVQLGTNQHCVPCAPDGLLQCSGTGFVTCAQGWFVYRDCASGTQCRPFQGSVLCDWPLQPFGAACTSNDACASGICACLIPDCTGGGLCADQDGEACEDAGFGSGPVATSGGVLDVCVRGNIGLCPCTGTGQVCSVTQACFELKEA